MAHFVTVENENEDEDKSLGPLLWDPRDLNNNIIDERYKHSNVRTFQFHFGENKKSNTFLYVKYIISRKEKVSA